MSPSFQVLRLRRLIEDHLGTYTGSEIAVSSREDEKNLLIAVSQVLRQLQLWTRELDCSSDSEMEAQSAADGEFLGEDSEECRCLCDIVCDVMVLLEAESEHVRHVTGNLLLAISDFFSASESNWHLFIHLLFVYTLFLLSNISSHPSASLHDDPRCELQSYILRMKPWLQNAGQFALAEITRVLRYTWKNLTEEDGDDLVQAYLNSLNYFLSKIPVNILDAIYVGQNGADEKIHGSDHLSFRCSQEPEHVFLGYLIQLLCSVTGQLVCVEVQSGSSNRHPALSTISGLVPKLFNWCLNGLEDQPNTCISIFFRHKLLMLMIRLSIPDDFHGTFGSWLQLLQSYFREFLWKPISNVQTLGTNSLEGSPFASILPDKKMHLLSIPHLQRQATYLFLRCSFGLINLPGQIDEPCSCPALDSLCNHNNGLKDLNQWLKKNVATDNLPDSKVYLGKCIGFSSSLLQFYMHEDDLLFKVLLQMLNVQLNASRESHKGGSIPYMDEEFLLHMSNIFNSIMIFHIFLAEIRYDHEVLLDYLISKDIGTSCVQYLLRCLRVVCDKFEAFLEFPVNDGTEEPLSKRRKSLIQGTNELGDHSSLLSLEKHFGGDHISVCKNQKMRGQPFEEAKRCLFSLKDSLESLNQKNLFPYNPKALLKRLVLSAPIIFHVSDN